MRIFITGGTGLVGRLLVPQLLNRQDEVVCVSRDEGKARDVLPSGARIVAADPTRAGEWQDVLKACDAVVNLAGEPVADGFWTSKKKARIRRSRLGVTEHVVAAMNASGREQCLVNASAVGFYGDRGDAALAETSEPGQDFLARLSVEWEHTASQAEREGARVALLRIGIVLSREGGALPRLVTPFRLGLGGPLGSGQQYFPWLHIQDLVRIIIFTLDNPEISGPVNACVPNPPQQKEFAAALGGVLGKPSWLPAPAFAMRMLLGEKADMILASQRVVPNVLKAHGFRFAFGEMDDALADLFP